MARQGKNDSTPAPKASKPKSAKALAKREQNVREAEARLARLQAQQRLVNAKRATGAVGSDATIMRLVDAEERSAEEARAKNYVEAVLSGPHGERVKKWLGKGIAGGPTRVAMIIRNYLQTNGWKEAV